MGDLFQDGVNFFNSGKYFAAHEVWEDLWRESTGPLRRYYQGLIQAAVGLHHAANGNGAGARAQLAKSIMKLEQYPDTFCSINNAKLVSDLRHLLQNSCSGPILIEQI